LRTINEVGLIITDISNTFFSEFLIGVQNTLEEVGLTVLLGTYPSSRMDCSTFSRVASEIRGLLRTINEAVDVETPVPALYHFLPSLFLLSRQNAYNGCNE
jgi:hypothetical protein